MSSARNDAGPSAPKNDEKTRSTRDGKQPVTDDDEGPTAVGEGQPEMLTRDGVVGGETITFQQPKDEHDRCLKAWIDGGYYIDSDNTVADEHGYAKGLGRDAEPLAGGKTSRRSAPRSKCSSLFQRDVLPPPLADSFKRVQRPQTGRSSLRLTLRSRHVKQPAGDQSLVRLMAVMVESEISTKVAFPDSLGKVVSSDPVSAAWENL